MGDPRDPQKPAVPGAQPPSSVPAAPVGAPDAGTPTPGPKSWFGHPFSIRADDVHRYIDRHAHGDPFVEALKRAKEDGVIDEQEKKKLAKIWAEQNLKTLSMLSISGMQGSADPPQRPRETKASKEVHWIEVQIHDLTQNEQGLDNVVFWIDITQESTNTVVPRKPRGVGTGVWDAEPGIWKRDPFDAPNQPSLRCLLDVYKVDPGFHVESVVWDGPGRPLRAPEKSSPGERFWFIGDVKGVSPPAGRAMLAGLQSIASAENLTLEQLIQFNFGLEVARAFRSKPASLMRALYRLVGCTRFALGDEELEFDGEEPGKIWVPVARKEQSLAFDTSHPFKVRRFKWPKLPNFIQLKVKCGHCDAPADGERWGAAGKAEDHADPPRNYGQPYWFFAEIEGELASRGCAANPAIASRAESRGRRRSAARRRHVALHEHHRSASASAGHRAEERRSSRHGEGWKVAAAHQQNETQEGRGRRPRPMERRV
jgi:hypothetical protein